MAKQQPSKSDAAEKPPAPIATTYYAAPHVDGKARKWRIYRVCVYEGPRFEQVVHMEHPEMLVISERLRVLLEQVLP